MQKLLSILYLLPIIAFGQSELNVEKLDDYFQQLDEHQQTMASVSISKNRKLEYQKSIGFADVEKKQKSNAQTQYRIGSISKMFTAVMVMQLVVEEKLSLEDKLSDYYPSVKNADKITIDMLLQHRSGIQNFTNDAAFINYMQKGKSHREMVEIISAADADFEPDAKAAYSNANYVLLGYILEDIEKSSYKKILKKRITKPLLLSRTEYGGKIKTKKNQAQSYLLTDAWQFTTESDMSIPGGAGSIISTPNDLCLFAEALFNGELIPMETVNQMLVLKDDYGKGIFLYPFYNKLAYGHTGGIDNFVAQLLYFRDEKVAVAFCSNGQNRVLNDIMLGTLSIYFNYDYEIPSFEELELNQDDLKAFEGVYTNAQLGMDLNIFIKDEALMAQATGQSAFRLTATSSHVFEFVAGGIVLKFADDLPNAKSLVLEQGGGKFTFTRK